MSAAKLIFFSSEPDHMLTFIWCVHFLDARWPYFKCSACFKPVPNSHKWDPWNWVNMEKKLLSISYLRENREKDSSIPLHSQQQASPVSQYKVLVLLHKTSQTHCSMLRLYLATTFRCLSRIILDVSGMKVDISPCTVCGMKVWNKSALVQHVTTEKRKWGDRLPEGAAGHLSVGRESLEGILGNKTAAPTFPCSYCSFCPQTMFENKYTWIRFEWWCPDFQILDQKTQMEIQLPPIQPTFMQLVGSINFGNNSPSFLHLLEFSSACPKISLNLGVVS